MNAVEATGQAAASDLERLEETLYALRTLAYLQPSISEVSSVRPTLPFQFFHEYKQLSASPKSCLGPPKAPQSHSQQAHL